MIRIPLLTSLDQPELTYLNNVVLLLTPRKFVRTTFILDTGSPKTILGFADAVRLQVPFNSLSKGDIVRLGGRKYQGYIFNRLKFKFKTEDENLIEESHPITVVKPISQKDNLEDIPTIIGMDFLKEKRYRLFCDMHKDKAYLEKD